MSIVVRGIAKRFGAFEALKDVSLEVPNGELVALLGPSGSGKTSLLRIIAGLETPDAGSVLFHGEDATDRKVRDRHVGFVFQHYALFRHMSVFENVAFGLRVMPRKTRPGDPEIRNRVMELLKLVQLDWLSDRYPSQLSGGQRQRVALARALAVKPAVLLLDEPFGALDAKVRKELRRWLRRLHQEVQVTTVFVTHDQEEAMEVADRIVVMNEGRVEQVGSPEEVYERPATPFVFSFLGTVNLFHGRDMVAFVRSHEVDLARTPNGDSAIETILRHARRFGPMVRVELDRVDNGPMIEAEIPRERFEELGVVAGERLYVKPSSARFFPPPSTS
jgi:sulfate transport system ATP-binding protein